MSLLTVPTLILAAGNDLWSFPSWKTRTGNIKPPFEGTDETIRLDPYESWQLVVMRNVIQDIHHKKSTFDNRIKYIQRGYETESNVPYALEIWNFWANQHLESWNIQSDIEDIFLQFGRHPSQMRATLRKTGADLVGPILVNHVRFLSDLPRSSSFKDACLHTLVPFVADLLFGEDAYLDPLGPNSLIKFELYHFVSALLPVTWLAAAATYFT
jgi:hypothetical protein